MSSDTAPGSASRYGTAGESDDAITPVANGHDHTENVAVWRESTHEDTIRSVNSDITRYDPDLLPRVRREFPEARLTIDRRIFAAEQNAAFVRRQRMLTWLLFVLAVLVWPFGGFALINSAEENGVAARAALLELSVRLGGEPVNNINERDVVLAGRLAVVGPFVWFGGFVVLVSVLIAALW